MKKSAFSLVELFIVVAVFTLILAFLLPGVQGGRSRELANRAKCSSRLKGIGTALHIYANDHRDFLPMVGRPGGGGFGRGLYGPGQTRWAEPNFTDWDRQATAGGCLYLLVKYADMTPGSFVCPSTSEKEMSLLDAAEVCREKGLKAPLSWAELNDFPTLANLSYSYHDVWTSLTTSKGNSGLAVAADKNPVFATLEGSRRGDLGREPVPNPDGSWLGSKNPRTAMSPNHGGEVNIVLFLMGNVKQADTPQVGIKEDNIYSAWGARENPIPHDYRIGRWDGSHAAGPQDCFLGN